MNGSHWRMGGTSVFRDGNDGPWSSFTLQIGTPPQDVKVFISTAGTQTWVVVPEGGGSSDPSNCPALRGGEFALNQSSTWVSNLIDPPSNIYDLYVESNLGYTGSGEYGFETITLGWQGSDGPSLKNQTIAGVATEEFYLGVFGINPRPSNFTTFDDPVPSYMENLRDQSLIPSTSWGYTGGNPYRLGQTLGSLTLGGYDASKFVPNDISWAFNQRDIRDISIDVSQITITSSNSTSSALQTTISLLIDSTVSHIWLPLESCTEFEKAFNLTWDNKTELYLLNDSQHAALLAENANVTFTLTSQESNLNITLPYSAFDLIAHYPIVSRPTRYFPLKRALNESQYTLGRTFLQEMYLIVDYDRQNFSVSQCKWVQDSKQDIIAILPRTNSTTNSTANFPLNPPHKIPAYGTLSLAKNGDIIAAVATGICLISLLVYFKIVKPHRRKREFDSIAEENLKPELDSGSSKDKFGFSAENIETDGRPVYEAAEERSSDVGLVIAEADGRPFYRHEMDVNEEVAIEMTGLSLVPELDGNVRSMIYG